MRLAKAVQGVFDVAEADYPFPSTYITRPPDLGTTPRRRGARVACSELLDLMVEVTDDRVTVDGVSVS